MIFDTSRDAPVYVNEGRGLLLVQVPGKSPPSTRQVESQWGL